MSAKKRITRLGAALGLAAALSVGLTGIANAANQDGVKNSGELIYYYNSNKAGSYSDFGIKIDNLAGYTYKWAGTTSAGKNSPVKNNAASIENKAILMTARVYYLSNQAGVYDSTGPNSWKNLAPGLKNENASHQWVW